MLLTDWLVDCCAHREEQFVNYRTSAYKLHLFETLSGYKFVMLSDPKADSLRFVLRQIYTGPFLEYVVRNPIVKMDSREYGVDNEYFRTSVDRLVRGLSVFSWVLIALWWYFLIHSVLYHLAKRHIDLWNSSSSLGTNLFFNVARFQKGSHCN